MNKQVSTKFSIILIIILAVAVSIYALDKKKEVVSLTNNNSAALAYQAKKVKAASSCKSHVYKGSAKINIWKSEKDGKDVLEVAKNDLSQLPAQNSDNFKIVDVTPELSKKIDSSSEKNPVEIDISGIATNCDGNAFLALFYKDGVFKSYLN